MRNLIVVISLVFIAIVAVSYFYFLNLGDKQLARPHARATEALSADTASPEVFNASRPLWTFALNGGSISHPSVHWYTDSTRFILVQDAYHILHAISPDGQKLWNAQLPGPVVDSVSQLPDRSLVFTTAERLYRIDTHGDPLPGFSLKLPQRATNGAVIINQQSDGTARIQVSTNRQDLTYDGRGKLLRRQTLRRNARTDDGEADRAFTDLSYGCGPLAYIGPLRDDNQRYLLCSKKDGNLYCYPY